MWPDKRRLGMMAAGAIVIFAAVFGGRTLWRAQDILRDARARTDSESSLRFVAASLDTVLPAGLESVGAPAVFKDAAIFNGHLFIAGPAGLSEYHDGTLIHQYRPGAELPSAPVTALAVGLAGDSHTPELWVATKGEGLVAFDGRSFRQIRAEEARFRKITSLLPLDTGRILMGTEKSGVIAWDGRELKPFHVSLADVQVTALAGDART